MAYLSAIVNEFAPFFVMRKIRDLCIEAGWEDVTPQGGDPRIIGYFLKSTGESGNENINVHFWTGLDRWNNIPTKGYYSYTGYLANDIQADTTTITLDSASHFPGTSGGVILIDNELIAFSGRSGNDLTNCSRGYLYTTSGNPPPSNGPAAPHSAGAAVRLVYSDYDSYYNEQLFGEIFVNRDLNNYIHTSTFNVSGVGQATCAAIGDGIRDVSNYFNYHTLIRLGSGPDYHWRWVKAHSYSSGTHTFDFSKTPLPTSFIGSDKPGALFSGGFMPGYSRRNNSSDTAAGAVHAAVWATLTKMYFIYVSKDYIWIVVRYSGNYYLFFIGRVIPPQSSARDEHPTNPTIEICTFGATYTNCVYSDIGKIVKRGITDLGTLWHYDNTAKTWYINRTQNVNVKIASGDSLTISSGAGAGTTNADGQPFGFLTSNIKFYEPNKKLRIFSTTVNDHLNPRNLKTEADSSWPPLDPEEIPTEEYVVQLRIPRSITFVFNGSGYVLANKSDLGTVVTGNNSGNKGILISYDNDQRTWIVYPAFDAENWFLTDTAVTAASGHGGTLTSKSLSADGMIKSTQRNYYIYSDAVSGQHPFPYCRSFNYDSDYSYLIPCYFWSPSDQIWNHASHRQTYRAFHQSGNKYNPHTSSLNYARLDYSSFFGTVVPDYVLDGYVPALLVALRSSDNDVYGVFRGVFGVLPNIGYFSSTPNAVTPEDYFLALVNGEYKKYRYFYNGTEPSRYCLGPEN